MEVTDNKHAVSSAEKTVLAISGSLRHGSFNGLLLRAARECVPSGMSIHIYDGLGAIPLFDEDLERDTGGGPDAVRRLRQEVALADALLIATPEYNQSIPGVLKNMIDWLSRPCPDEVLVGKPVALIGASAGPWGTRAAQIHLRHVLYATESLVMLQPGLFMKHAADQFDDAGWLTDVAARGKLTTVLKALNDWIAKVGN